MRIRSLILLSALGGSLNSAPAQEPATLFEQKSIASPVNPIDDAVFRRLKKMGIRPVLCSDEVFVRRVYLDVIGRPPTTVEAVRFLDQRDSTQKRSHLIEELLARDEYADYWAMKWGDTLRIKAEFPINLWPNAAQAYHRWVRASIAENKPYDRFVREMLTASGSNFRVGPANFYRALQNKTPEGITEAVALTFMGTRSGAWKDRQMDNMKLFFSGVGYKPTSEWKEEIVFWDPLGTAAVKANSAPGRDLITTAAVTGIVTQVQVPPREPVKTAFPDGKKTVIPPDRDPRELFADWLITADNPWFSRCIVNRVWAWLLGRGIIHEPDDIRKDNPPSNPELLEWLEEDFAAHRYDLKHLYRVILNSATYQLSSLAGAENPEAAAQFAFYPVRRLDAEVLIDAINRITGETDLYTSAIPEPFTYIPKDQTAVSIADGSITSPFLALFGRSARATGMFTERDSKATPAQCLHLLNSSHIQAKLEKGTKIKNLTAPKNTPEQITENLYLAILSRRPTADEVRTVLEYTGSNAPTNRQQDKTAFQARQNNWIDIAWSLINSPEFLYRH